MIWFEPPADRDTFLMRQNISAAIHLKKNLLSLVEDGYEKIDELSYLLWFTLISHLLGTWLLQPLPPQKNHLISVAKNLLRVLSHQQVSLKDPMMDGSEQQKRAKRLTLQSVSSKKALRACPRPHWCDVKWLNAQKTDNRSCDTCGRKRPGPPTLTGW